MGRTVTVETIFNTSPHPGSQGTLPILQFGLRRIRGSPVPGAGLPQPRGCHPPGGPAPGPGFGAVDGETALRQVMRIFLISFRFCPSQLTDGQALLLITEPGPSSQTALRVKRAGSEQSSVVSSHTHVHLVGNPTRLPELLSVSRRGIRVTPNSPRCDGGILLTSEASVTCCVEKCL